jgi:LysM repeat protein
MKSRFSLVVSLCVLVLLALTVAACEKERPAPTPTRAAGQGAATTPGAKTPAPNQTTVALPTPLNGGAVVTGTAAAPVSAAGATSGAAAGQAGQGLTYKVAKGDTLAQIARKFNVTAESIVTLNQLTDPDVLMLGQELKIPGDASAASGTYTVQAGDTLGSIAQKLGVSMADLVKANNITDPNQVTVGQVLKAPQATSGGAAAAPAAAPAAGAKTYTVQKGDTLFNIAVRFGVTTAALQQANNLTNPNQIYVGQKLTLP